MSKQLNAALVALAAAATALAAAIPGDGEAAPAGSDKPAGKSTGKTTTTKAKPTHTRAELTAVLNELKENKGASVAKELIKSVGKSDKLAEVADANIDALFDAAKEALGGEEPEEENDGL